MKNYTIKQLSEIVWDFSFVDTNEKGEKLTIELTKFKNYSSPKSLPNLWKKMGYIDRVLDTYWRVETFVEDTEGNTFGLYNPQCKIEEDEDKNQRVSINFDWMFEATEENKEKLINETYRLFSLAKGKTATEEKLEKIKKYSKENNLDIYKTIPQGWKQLKGCLTTPIGSVLISNMKPLKSGYRKKAILLID